MSKILETVGAIIYIIVIGVSSLFGPKCEVSLDCVECNFPIEHGFDFMEIEVTELNEDGSPSLYDVTSRLHCAPFSYLPKCLGDDAYSNEEKAILEEKRQIMDTIMKLNGGIIGGPGHSTRIMEYIRWSNVMDSIKESKFSFRPQKSVCFQKRTKNYKWTFLTENKVWGGYSIDCEKGIMDTLPLKFRTNQWYLIDVSTHSSAMRRVFFRIKENGKIEQYYDDNISYF